jgi:hypothetical protein
MNDLDRIPRTLTRISVMYVGHIITPVRREINDIMTGRTLKSLEADNTHTHTDFFVILTLRKGEMWSAVCRSPLIIAKKNLAQSLRRISSCYRATRCNILLQKMSRRLLRKHQRKHMKKKFFLLVCITI